MRGRLALGVLMGLALLLAFSSLGSSRRADAPAQLPPSDTPTASATPVVSDTPTPSDTPIPSNTPTSTAAPTGVPPTNTLPPGAPTSSAPKPPGVPPTPGSGIRTNACARVVGADGLILGDAPGFGANHVQIVAVDDIVFVTDGPQRADGLWWWKVVTRQAVAGWGINDQIAPHSGECFGLAAGASATATAQAASASARASATALGGQAQLPSTGSTNTGLYLAGVLIVALVAASVIRRRSQRALDMRHPR